MLIRIISPMYYVCSSEWCVCVCVWLLINCLLRVLTQELQAFDSPQLITLIDGVRDDNQICVGYKNQFDLINEKNGDTLQLYQVEANKVNPIIHCCHKWTSMTYYISSVLEKHLAYLWWPIIRIASDAIFPKPLNATLYLYLYRNSCWYIKSLQSLILKRKCALSPGRRRRSYIINLKSSSKRVQLYDKSYIKTSPLIKAGQLSCNHSLV